MATSIIFWSKFRIFFNLGLKISALLLISEFYSPEKNQKNIKYIIMGMAVTE